MTDQLVRTGDDESACIRSNRTRPFCGYWLAEGKNVTAPFGSGEVIGVGQGGDEKEQWKNDPGKKTHFGVLKSLIVPYSFCWRVCTKA